VPFRRRHYNLRLLLKYRASITPVLRGRRDLPGQRLTLEPDPPASLKNRGFLRAILAMQKFFDFCNTGRLAAMTHSGKALSDISD
jgi:hypothetical protein